MRFFWGVFFLLSLICFHSNAKTLVLTANQVKDLSLSQSQDVQMVILDFHIGSEDLSEAKSIYDTVITSEVSHAKDQSQRTSTAFGTNTQQTIYNLELGQKTPLGTELGFGFVNERETTNSIFSTVNPAYNSQLQLSLSQPLLQNTFGVVDRSKIQATKKLVSALNFTTKAAIQKTVYSHLVAYWDFYWRHHLVQMEVAALSKARSLYQANQKKLELGVIEKSDLEAFSANVAIHESLWLQAKSDLVSATEKLKVALLLPEDEDLKPLDEKTGAKVPGEMTEILKKALETRPDYLALKESLEASRLMVVMAKNNRWPEMDVQATLALNGISTDYGTAIENIGDGHPLWAVGMEFNFPLQNRYRKSESRKSEIERGKKIIQVKQKELEVRHGIRESFVRYENALDKRSAALRARTSQYNKMEGEQKKYQAGRSDSDILIRYQNDYIDARKMALAAEVEVEMAWMNLQLVQGKILE